MCGFFFFLTPEALGPLRTGKRGLTGPSVPSFHPLQSCPQHRRQQRGRQSYRARSSSILFINAASFKKQAQERGWGGSAPPLPPCFPDSFGFPSCERQCPLAKNELLGTPGRRPWEAVLGHSKTALQSGGGRCQATGPRAPPSQAAALAGPTGRLGAAGWEPPRLCAKSQALVPGGQRLWRDMGDCRSPTSCSR